MGKFSLKLCAFFLLNFATPVAFFWAFHLWGAKPAIGLAIGVAVAQFLAHLFFRVRMSPFYLVATGFTVFFGLVDLFLSTPRFFRLEPFAQNALIGTVFLITLFTSWPIVTWFAAGLPAPIRPRLDGGMESYFRKLTCAWGIYLWLKALLFLYLAFSVDLGDLIMLRSLIGGGTMAAMVLGEIAYRKYFLVGVGLSGPPLVAERPRRSARSG